MKSWLKRLGILPKGEKKLKGNVKIRDNFLGLDYDIEEAYELVKDGPSFETILQKDNTIVSDCRDFGGAFQAYYITTALPFEDSSIRAFVICSNKNSEGYGFSVNLLAKSDGLEDINKFADKHNIDLKSGLIVKTPKGDFDPIAQFIFQKTGGFAQDEAKDPNPILSIGFLASHSNLIKQIHYETDHPMQQAYKKIHNLYEDGLLGEKTREKGQVIQHLTETMKFIESGKLQNFIETGKIDKSLLMGGDEENNLGNHRG